ncbi:CBS domain-containing protein [Gammaproteobacteria bacterium]|nr:CBS domain-containing protein [Gammaproteobacteria bacterium]
MADQRFTVADYMSSRLISLRADMDIAEAIELFVVNRISGAPVVDDAGALIGVLSESDCIGAYIQCAYNEGAGCGRVSDQMSTEVKTIEASTDLIEASSMFREHRLRRIPVIRNGKLVGQISRHDILKAIHANRWA